MPNFEQSKDFQLKSGIMGSSPVKQVKTHYKGENTEENKLKNLSVEQQSHLDKLSKRKTTANTETEYLNFNKKYTNAVDSIYDVNTQSPKRAITGGYNLRNEMSKILKIFKK